MSNIVTCIGVLWVLAAITIMRINEVDEDWTILFWISFGSLVISIGIALKNKWSNWQLLFIFVTGTLTIFVSYAVYAILHLSVM